MRRGCSSILPAPISKSDSHKSISQVKIFLFIYPDKCNFSAGQLQLYLIMLLLQHDLHMIHTQSSSCHWEWLVLTYGVQLLGLASRQNLTQHHCLSLADDKKLCPSISRMVVLMCLVLCHPICLKITTPSEFPSLLGLLTFFFKLSSVSLTLL